MNEIHGQRAARGGVVEHHGADRRRRSRAGAHRPHAGPRRRHQRGPGGGGGGEARPAGPVHRRRRRPAVAHRSDEDCRREGRAAGERGRCRRGHRAGGRRSRRAVSGTGDRPAYARPHHRDAARGDLLGFGQAGRARGFGDDDTKVALLVANAGGPAVVTDAVDTRRIATTILGALGIDPGSLAAVQKEQTAPLPGLSLPQAL